MISSLILIQTIIDSFYHFREETSRVLIYKIWKSDKQTIGDQFAEFKTVIFS